MIESSLRTEISAMVAVVEMLEQVDSKEGKEGRKVMKMRRITRKRQPKKRKRIMALKHLQMKVKVELPKITMRVTSSMMTESNMKKMEQLLKRSINLPLNKRLSLPVERVA